MNIVRHDRLMKAGIAALVIATLAVGAVTVAKAQNTVDFSLTTTISADKTQLTPKLTWSTTPAATSCTASGADTEWTATPAKGASGTQTLAAFPATESRGYALVCNWPGDTQAALAWVPPTTMTDGSPLPKCAAATDTGACLAGYLIEFGPNATTLNQSRFHMFPQSTGTPVTGLTPGSTYFFAVRAIAGTGAQSARSNTVSKSLPAGVQVTQQAGIKTPSAPTLN